ncbi:IQ domain-containing protein K isoform X2 [Suncus etruscus]|uniref:IQ domain-containing protein K isoform X2 n=1 Tax=Suncus etruscus TaxID=109475 RepID=UPI00211028EE|nr:IQ domain-containing protein K isoform X2 [Suncus etruscus]
MVGGGPAPLEEPPGSTESLVRTRTSAPTVSPAEPGPLAEAPGRSLWEQIGEEIEAEKPPSPEGYKVAFTEGDKVKQEAASIVSTESIFHGFNAQYLHTLLRSSALPHRLCSQVQPKEIDPQTCSPREYLEVFVFPTLLPGMENLLQQAEREKCFQRKKTKFIACDYLTQWLYNQNPKRAEEAFLEFFSIPFVEQWLKDHPRPPISLSLLLSEEEAAVIIQAFWRGYLCTAPWRAREAQSLTPHGFVPS